MTGRVIPWSSYVIVGILVLIVLLGMAAALWPVMNCPNCARPKGFFDIDIHFCRQGKVSYFQWWKFHREMEREKEKWKAQPH